MRAKWVNENIINKNVALKQFMSFKDDLYPCYETDSVALDAGVLWLNMKGFTKSNTKCTLTLVFEEFETAVVP